MQEAASFMGNFNSKNAQVEDIIKLHASKSFITVYFLVVKIGGTDILL